MSFNTTFIHQVQENFELNHESLYLAVKLMEIEIDKKTERQKDRQTERQKDRQTEIESVF